MPKAVDWAAARLAYVNSSKSLAAIAKQFGAQPKTVEKRAERENWSEARRNLSESVGKVAQATITEVRADALSRFNEDDLKVARALRAQVAAHINEAQQAKRRIPPADLRALSGAAEVSQRIGRLALGATTENTSVTTKELPASVDDFV